MSVTVETIEKERQQRLAIMIKPLDLGAFSLETGLLNPESYPVKI